MTKIFTTNNKEITFDFLTKESEGKDFLQSQECINIFSCEENKNFFNTKDGKKWVIETDEGLNMYRKIKNIKKEIKFFTEVGREINFIFLTKSKAGKSFIDSLECSNFFTSLEGLRFLLSTEGQKWIAETNEGFEIYEKNAETLMSHHEGRELLIKKFGAESENKKLSLMKYAISKKAGKLWYSYEYGKNKFKEFLCSSDGLIGYQLLEDNIGSQWCYSNEGIKTIFSIGNEFFFTQFGKRFLSKCGSYYFSTTIGKEWIINEGSWIFEFYRSNDTKFFDWIVTIHKHIQQKVLNTPYAKELFISEQYEWFDKHGEDLFNKQIIYDDDCKTFSEYRNKLLSFLEITNKNTIENLINNKDIDPVFILKFIINDWMFGNFWLSFDKNKSNFKKLFLSNNVYSGNQLISSIIENKRSRKVNLMSEYNFTKDSIDDKLWFDTKIGKETMAYIGNDFFKTKYGKEMLFCLENKFINSNEGKEWIVKEGSWIFNETNFYISDSIEFGEWILTTPENIQIDYFRSVHGELFLMNDGFCWFEKHGEKLFEKKIIGEKTFSSSENDDVVVLYNFDEYKNELIKKRHEIEKILVF